MLTLFVIGVVTSFLGVGFILIAIAGLWALIDAFLIPGMVSRQKDDVRERLTMQAMRYSGAAAQIG